MVKRSAGHPVWLRTQGGGHRARDAQQVKWPAGSEKQPPQATRTPIEKHFCAQSCSDFSGQSDAGQALRVATNATHNLWTIFLDRCKGLVPLSRQANAPAAGQGVCRSNVVATTSRPDGWENSAFVEPLSVHFSPLSTPHVAQVMRFRCLSAWENGRPPIGPSRPAGMTRPPPETYEGGQARQTLSQSPLNGGGARKRDRETKRQRVIAGRDGCNPKLILAPPALAIGGGGASGCGYRDER